MKIPEEEVSVESHARQKKEACRVVDVAVPAPVGNDRSQPQSAQVEGNAGWMNFQSLLFGAVYVVVVVVFLGVFYSWGMSTFVMGMVAVGLLLFGLMALAQKKMSFTFPKLVAVLLIAGPPVYMFMKDHAVLDRMQSASNVFTDVNREDSGPRYAEVLSNGQCVNVDKSGRMTMVKQGEMVQVTGVHPKRIRPEDMGRSADVHVVRVRTKDRHGNFSDLGASCIVDALAIGPRMTVSEVRDLMQERKGAPKKREPHYEKMGIFEGRGLSRDMPTRMHVRTLEHGRQTFGGDWIQIRSVNGKFPFKYHDGNRWVDCEGLVTFQSQAYANNPGVYTYVAAPKGKFLEISILRR